MHLWLNQNNRNETRKRNDDQLLNMKERNVYDSISETASSREYVWSLFCFLLKGPLEPIAGSWLVNWASGCHWDNVVRQWRDWRKEHDFFCWKRSIFRGKVRMFLWESRVNEWGKTYNGNRADFASWRGATQTFQASQNNIWYTLVHEHQMFYQALKFRPSGGAPCWPACCQSWRAWPYYFLPLTSSFTSPTHGKDLLPSFEVGWQK